MNITTFFFSNQRNQILILTLYFNVVIVVISYLVSNSRYHLRFSFFPIFPQWIQTNHFLSVVAHNLVLGSSIFHQKTNYFSSFFSMNESTQLVLLFQIRNSTTLESNWIIVWSNVLLSSVMGHNRNENRERRVGESIPIPETNFGGRSSGMGAATMFGRPLIPAYRIALKALTIQ